MTTNEQFLALQNHKIRDLSSANMPPIWRMMSVSLEYPFLQHRAGVIETESF